MFFFSFQLVLMHYKADVNAPDNDGNTPLHLCTANGHEKVMKNYTCTVQPINGTGSAEKRSTGGKRGKRSTGAKCGKTRANLVITGFVLLCF